jgi:hypothetical protein
VTSSDVLVMYTFDGALDFTHRSVIATDYGIIDNGFNNHDTDYADGDLNYDGAINGDDYTLMDNAFNTQTIIPLSVTAGPAVQVATAKPAAMVAVQAATGTDDDSELKKHRASVWADLEN